MKCNPDFTHGAGPVDPRSVRDLMAPYQAPTAVRSAWQVLNTLVPFALLWWIMYRCLAVSYWLALPFAVLAAGFHVRIFIIFHDCGHGSFFKSRLANDLLGCLAGVLTFTPYFQWRWEHAVHHSSAGNLDKRGTGDVWTLTVQEYLEAGRWKRFAYRLVRNPVVLFGVGPLVLFLVLQRLVVPKAGRRERLSVYGTNLALLAMAAAHGWFFGLSAYLVLQLTVLLVAGSAGVWLFYVQHQFEGVYWARHGEWDYATGALQGSSFYKLPRILQWFTGNIGFHHVHHLRPGIPNYRLEKCHNAVPLFQSVKPITLFSSLKSITFRLWDEPARRLVGFGHLRTIRQRRKSQVPS